MIPIGKVVANHSYFHICNLNEEEPDLKILVQTCLEIADLKDSDEFNVIKLSRDHSSLTLLDYPTFDQEGFPVLRRYWTVDLEKRTARFRSYEESLNPPILHRKELLVPEGYPERNVYSALTQAAEQVGLFDDPHRIGFKHAWEKLVSQKGYRVVGHELVPIGNDENALEKLNFSDNYDGVARHLTALTRYGFSGPMQTLARFKFLDGSKTVFDYGCGRGDDLRGLLENNIVASGWDPHFFPDDIKRNAHIVNLGFVINVIENYEERAQALRGAYALADELLLVSAMIANQEAANGTPYGDGVLTSRNTFQKYYTQGELRQYIAEILQEEPIPVGPGIFYVFKNKDSEQRFMYGRQENRRNILRLTNLSRPEKPARIDRAQAKYDQHRDLLENLWETCLILGRDPSQEEIQDLASIKEHLGSLSAALRFIKSRKENPDEILDVARQSRINDLRIYFAQLQFQKRKPYSHLETRLQQDVKAFFGDYRMASESGRELLFAIASIETIDAACKEAAHNGIGWLEEGHSLQLHTSMVGQLPALLRTYVICGTVLYGDVSSADLIKIHIRSGKLTLMKFDDFINTPLPRMIQRVKLNLRRQELDVFDYRDPYEPPYLFGKSRFINEEFQNYAEQISFEEHIENLNLCDFSGYGPRPQEFDALLEKRRYVVEGFSLNRSKTIPNIDEPCGKFLKYRDLIECGETQAKTGLPNLPKEPDSYTALLELVINILDPVIEYFGMIKLSFGFCSPALAKQIPGRIAPELDQHAAHEKKNNGKFVCERLGAACDFFIEDENMREVANWMFENTICDRIYFYGANRPIHISYATNPKRQLIEMKPGPSGKLIPKIKKNFPSE
jgi:DNA phosphorothioation-associated putative methyltransferase